MIDLGQHNVLGIKIAAVDYQRATEKVIEAARHGNSCPVSALAVHGLMTGVLDRVHRHRLNHFDMLVPDGQPVRWALRWLHQVSLPDRVYGPNLMLEICGRAAEEGLPIFLFGGNEELLETLANELQQRFPDLPIAGRRASMFRQLTPEEKVEVASEIRSSGARLVFVGIGCPRQEIWAYEFRNDLPMPLIAVGAAFNFHAGLLPQAPEWMQRYGLEWLFRLWQEPLRLWRRYLLLNPLFLSMILCQKTGLRRFDPEDTTTPSHELLYG